MLAISDHLPDTSLVVFFLLDFTFVCPVETVERGQGGAQ